MTKYSKHVAVVHQTEQASSKQVQNNAGGYSFKLDKWKQLDRFLILGSEGGTYYVGERKLTKDNAKCIEKCIKEDGIKTVARIVEVSDAGRAPKNDPAIFALAMCAGSHDQKTRTAALQALPKVCRIGTHLFHFAEDVTQFRRWGRGLRTAVANWYTQRSDESLAMQLVKYQQRDGWSHRDLLRLSHAVPETPEQNAAFRWAVGGLEGLDRKNFEGRAKPKKIAAKTLPELIQGFEEIKGTSDVQTAVRLIDEYGLPRECVPTELLNNPQIWEALFPTMGITALIRNLGKMSAIGLLKPLSAFTKAVCCKLTDPNEVGRSRVHPMTILYALKTYAQGRGEKGKLSWTPSQQVVEALDNAFYLAFGNVEPTGKNFMLALDVSVSMQSSINGTSLMCNEASAAMALVTARTEANHYIVGFGAGSSPTQWGPRYEAGIQPLGITNKMSLNQAVKATSSLNFGGTDCALPMIHATKEGLDIDAFVVYTDNETWSGNVHPHKALETYRQKSGRNAKLIVVGMTSTGFSIANPDDAGMLDVVGFDTAVPQVMSEFVKE